MSKVDLIKPYNANSWPNVQTELNHIKEAIEECEGNILSSATDEEIEAGTATNKALTPSNLNKVLSVLLGKNFGDTGHTISEILQHVVDSWPIPVEGDFQVFADPECTKYATGEVNKVYVRVNREFGFDEMCLIGTADSNSITVNTPNTKYHDDIYSILCYIDFSSQEQSTPFTAGQVVECCFFEEEGSGDVTDFNKVFTYVPKFVDLGLPSGTKWAECNLGAGNNYYYGKYFSWGNIDGVTSVDTEGIAAMTESAYAQTKGATLEGDIPATAEYDAVIARFQGIANCQIPTKAQFQELYDNCNWTWQENYRGAGIKGYIVTSKINGKSIFLPAAGYINDGTLGKVGTGGYYWSSSIYGEVEGYAYNLSFRSGDVYPDDSNGRYYGCSVRPVQNA